MRNGAIAIGALVGAIGGAVAGAYIQKFWAAEPMDAGDFGMRLAKLESEIVELEELQRKRRRRAERSRVDSGTFRYQRQEGGAAERAVIQEPM